MKFLTGTESNGISLLCIEKQCSINKKIKENRWSQVLIRRENNYDDLCELFLFSLGEVMLGALCILIIVRDI